MHRYLPEVSVSSVVRLRLFRRGLDAYCTWNSPCELTVYRFVPSNNPAIFFALAKILFLAVTSAAFPFVLTKVGPFVFFFSSFSTILHRVDDLLTP